MPHSHLAQIYKPDFGLLTDFYQLTMAQGYFRQGLHKRRAIFNLYYRKAPFGGDFVIFCGLPQVVDLLSGLRFSVQDIQFLGRQKGTDGKALFDETFLHYLQRLEFSGDVHAPAEGEVIYPNEPMLRVEASLLEAQLIETALLTTINFSSLVATKAARIKAAAGQKSRVLEFGLRRAQGIDGGLTASRAAYIGGCDGTSNVWAGRYYNIPVVGTHAHAWIMVFPEEIEAFRAYAEALPNNATLLVDTYDTIEGVKNAIAVGQELRQRGHELLGIRLDSGDLAALSKKARQLLDEAGFTDTAIVASNDLDEYKIAKLRADDAPITVWGVGTRLAACYDQPALGGVYKLAAIQDKQGNWQPKIKLSEQAIKVSNPGRLQIRRYYDEQGKPVGSQLYDELQGQSEPTIELTRSAEENPAKKIDLKARGSLIQKDLLKPYIQSGQLALPLDDLRTARERSLKNYADYTALEEHVYGLSEALYEQKLSLISSR
ncbi:MAG: nicotinate phosphoribosyltransferase [Bacteroidota bacterium]